MPTCHVHDFVACAGAIHKTEKKASGEIVAKQTKYKIHVQQKTKYNVSSDTSKFLIDTIDLIGHFSVWSVCLSLSNLSIQLTSPFIGRANVCLVKQ